MKNSILNIVAIIALLSLSTCNSNHEQKDFLYDFKTDSINSWLEQAESPSLNIVQREIILKKTYQLNKDIVNDSIRRYNLINISRISNGQVNTKLFNKFNKEAFDVSKKENDTLGLAKTHYYFGYNFSNVLEIYDSAYFHFNKAKHYNELLNRTEMVGWNLYEMASILINVKNYTGSEILIFEALENFKKENNTQGLAGCYSLLAIVFGNLEEYDQSLLYDLKVLNLLKVIEREKSLSQDQITEQKLIYLSNIGTTNFYKKNYLKALNFYLETFQNKELKTLNINLYNRTLHNINYTKFKLGDTAKVLENLNIALQSRDSLKDVSGVIDSKLDISQYYAFYNDTIKAIKYAYESKSLALSLDKNKNYLKSLILLSNLDQNNAKRYLDEYISLNDSLQNEERKLRNKFTRIQFETEEYKEQVVKQSHEKIIILWIAIGITFILGFLYYIILQRSKHQKLQFKKHQQKSNEEIYDLMLQQHSLKEEGQLKERRRISEELHDGIIGKIFGTRMNLGFLNFIGSPKEKQKYKDLILQLQDIEKEIRIISHELKSKEFESQHNFDSIINLLIVNQCQISELNHTITTDEDIDWNEIDGRVKINIYRILQEVLLNCHKHAKASEIHVFFEKTNKSVLLLVKDDGTGFDVKKREKGIGLSNLKSRVNNMSGTLKIKSTANGTQIIVTIPNSKL